MAREAAGSRINPFIVTAAEVTSARQAGAGRLLPICDLNHA